MQQEWFETWFDSPYYHILYQHRCDTEALDFVKNCVKQLNMQPGQKLLDMACGKGRHAKAFADLGLEVTGLDLSKESIENAKQFSNAKLHFAVHDMRMHYCSSCSDYITNLFTSFGYFTSEEDNQKAAYHIAEALKPGGRFLIDYVNRNHAIRNIEQNPSEQIRMKNLIFNISRSYSDVKFLKQIAIMDGEKELSFEEVVNSFTENQLKILFENAGLKHVSTFGDYFFSVYNSMHSPRMILVFEK